MKAKTDTQLFDAYEENKVKEKGVWEKSPFLANFRLLLKRKILLNQGLLIPRFSRIS